MRPPTFAFHHKKMSNRKTNRKSLARIAGFVVCSLCFLVTSTPVGKVSAVFGRDECVIAPQEIVLLGRKLGTVTRMCPKSLCMGLVSPLSCVFLRVKPPSPESGCAHVNTGTPSLISAPPWFGHSSGMFRNQSYLGYYSQHTLSTSRHVDREAAHPTLGLFVAENLGTGPWQDISHLLEVDAKSVACDSLHAPDVHVDSMHRKLFMYVYGHGCLRANGTRFANQPTFKFESVDGLIWQPSRHVHRDETQNHSSLPFMTEGLFYTRLLFMKDDVFVFGKSQENPEGYLTVSGGKTLNALPSQRQQLLKGVRHFSIHRVADVLLIFFTLISDSPERIMMGTLDLTKSWLEWEILPGPIILQPELRFEHGGVDISPSKAGSAGCKPKHELRDPFFFATDTSVSILRGWLLYAVKGEGGVALSQLELDLSAYLPMVEPYFSRQIPHEIINASSLATNDFPDHSLKEALVTGTGRSGTTYVCKLFSSLQLNISHDNDVDCGNFPGIYGSSSWYHAFRGPLPKSKYEKVSFNRVVHIVRDPLKVIHSRASRTFPSGVDFMKRVISDWEDTSELDIDSEEISFEDVSAWALKHWVRRNSFVHQFASWRVRIEDFAIDPWHSWTLCVAMGLGSSCPMINEFGKAVEAIPEDTNTGRRTDDEVILPSITTWEKLASRDQESRDHVRMALKLAMDFGYVIQDSLLERFEVDRVNYRCTFTKGGQRMWACRLEVHDI